MTKETLGQTFGKKFLKALLGIALGVVLLYGCSGGGGGESGDVSEMDGSGSVSERSTVAVTRDECLNQALDIVYDPEAPSQEMTISLECTVDKIAVVVIGANGAPTSKTYHLPQTRPGSSFSIPGSVWDAALEGAPKGSYDITLFVYCADNVLPIPGAGKINVLNDCPVTD